ncbi:MAG: hypothetical protein ABR549_16665 [Mycobacteriales bacterium]
MKIGCPVGHPSGPGRHCPLCGRDYVPIDQMAQDPYVTVPRPRPALDSEVVRADVQDRNRVHSAALAMLSSLASGDA